jgi:hypothetical protein
MEQDFFKDDGIRRAHLQLVYDYLSTVAPSSIESERAFSAANQICTKMRSRLNDSTTDCLCFLRAHFIRTGSVDA